MKKFSNVNNQYYLLCIHEGSYKSQKKKDNDEKISSTIKKGCKAQLYGRLEKNSQGKEKLVIKKINNLHNHPPLSEKEFKTAPQTVDLSEKAKNEANKLFQEGEKITAIIQNVIESCYQDVTDKITFGAIKKKLKNFLNNQNRKGETFDLNKIVQSLNGYNKEIVWCSYKENNQIETLFYTFKSLVQKGSKCFTFSLIFIRK